MLRRIAHRRAGITLLELLVVIGIIATLMGLLLTAVGRTMDVATRADTNSRAAAITNAINTFKAERHVTYIPGGQIDDSSTSTTYGQVVGPFRLRNSYPQSPTGTEPGATSFEARYLQQAFGTGAGLNLNNLGGGATWRDADLDANQTLLFFLNGVQEQDAATGSIAFRGFSKRPGQPFTPPDTSSLTEDRYRTYLDISTKHYLPSPAASAGKGYAWLVDGWKRPFAYYAAFNGKPPRADFQYGGYNDGTLFPPVTASPLQYMGTPKPYKVGSGFANESGCQIISAGKDGFFGLPPVGSTTAADWNNVDANGQDDRANFSTTNLGAGPN